MLGSMRVLALGVGIIFVLACPGGPPKDAEYSQVAVFVDLTEIQERGGITQLQDSALLENIFNLVASAGESRFNGGSLSFYTISDESIIRLRVSETLELGPRAENEKIRERDLRSFHQSIRARTEKLVEQMVDEAGQTTTEFIQNYQQSHIARPICDYLRTASQSIPGPNYLIIFSDLLENSSVYSFFGSHGDPLDALAGACSGVQGPLEIEYQVLQQELGPGAADLSSLQFEALQIWRMLFGELGLTENTGIISP